ncbi:hypothetical protein PYCCODRAFT_1372907 [Trametes coccinea BRFM310]|uniref:DUF6534 domain-containing protein n=1 Tax=Trametes coccinea (strain BRFM310) TaxID=1353009 RepID=A0A1Y2IEG3_TRAC3|nr:hypothetical protein PYCCODRAFT_1372907 [Trametes coccinea BRFM310]
MAKTIGAVALGAVLGVMLYGLTIHQVYRYTKMYPTDKPGLKIFVSNITALLETVHTALWLVAGLVNYHYLIEQPFVTVSSLNGHWYVLLCVENLLQYVCTCLSQIMDCRLIYHDQVGPRWRLLVIPAAALILVAKGSSHFSTSSNFRVTSKVSDFQRLNWLVATAYGVASVTDIIIAVSLVIVFHRSRTGSKRMNTVLDLLIAYTVNTGNAAQFCSSIILPGNLIYAGVSIVGTKLYANSVLAVLNSRRYINERWMDDFASIHLPDLVHDGSHLNAPTSDTLSWVPASVSLSFSACVVECLFGLTCGFPALRSLRRVLRTPRNVSLYRTVSRAVSATLLTTD